LEESIDIESIALSKDSSSSLISLIELIIGVVFKCEDSHAYIEKILDLDEDY
jgi:hypothetical protein